MLADLPEPIRSLVTGYAARPVVVGMSSGTVLRLYRPGCRALFLKSAPAGTLAAERDRLLWLRGRLPVPEVVAWASGGEREYLLTTALPGRDAAAQVGRVPAERIVRLLARALRRVHAVPIAHCPFDRRLPVVLAEARHNLEAGRVEVDDFDEERRGHDPAELFALLLRRRPVRDELVFTHGDYCLPNVILRGTRLSGIVDWGRAGVADRYQDLALAVRSIRRNLGPGWDAVFLRAYGLPDADPERLEYYQILDEFF